MFFPAKNALIPTLVEERDLAVANGLSYTTQQASMLIGLLDVGRDRRGVRDGRARRGRARTCRSSGRLVTPAAPYLLGPAARAWSSTACRSCCLGAAHLTGSACRAQAGARRGAFDLRLIGKDVVESFTFLGEHKELRGFLVSIGLAILGGGAIIPVGLVYVQQNLVGGIPFLELDAAARSAWRRRRRRRS